MAIDNFVKGKRYIFDYNQYRATGTGTFEIASSYAKITYLSCDVEVETNSYVDFFYEDSNDGIMLYENTLNNDHIADLEKGDYLIDTIEFVVGYSEDSPIKQLPSDNIKDFCELVEKKALVSIYNVYSSTWIDLPCPSDYNGISTTLVDSGRNTKGQVVGNVIASDIGKIELKWKFMSAQDFASMAQLFEQKYNGDFFVPVCFFNVVKNGYDGDTSSAPDPSTNPCRLFYCGDRKAQFAHIVLNDDGTPKGYADVSLNLIDTGKIYGADEE